MITARMTNLAARALCKRASEACNVDADDNWNVYGDDFIADAQAALDAAGAPEMLAALREAEAGLCFAGADIEPTGFVPAATAALRIVRAAIAKAEGRT